MPSCGVRASTRPSQPSARGSPRPASSSSPTAAMRSFLSSTTTSSPIGEARPAARIAERRRSAPGRRPACVHYLCRLNRTARLERYVDRPAGQLHCYLRVKACFRSASCSAACRFMEPAAVDADAGRDTRRTLRSSASGQVQAHERPRTLVRGLVLRPDHFGVRVLGQLGVDFLLRAAGRAAPRGRSRSSCRSVFCRVDRRS